MYPGTPDIIVSNLSVALRPNENDVERFGISASQILMLTHSANKVVTQRESVLLLIRGAAAQRVSSWSRFPDQTAARRLDSAH